MIDAPKIPKPPTGVPSGAVGMSGGSSKKRVLILAGVFVVLLVIVVIVLFQRGIVSTPDIERPQLQETDTIEVGDGTSDDAPLDFSSLLEREDFQGLELPPTITLPADEFVGRPDPFSPAGSVIVVPETP